jgi:hypothetical protein
MREHQEFALSAARRFLRNRFAVEFLFANGQRAEFCRCAAQLLVTLDERDNERQTDNYLMNSASRS